MATSSRPRLLVVVLHEATPGLVAPWAAAGRLPTFRRLMAEGAFGRLRTGFPLFSPQRWGNMVTGRRAEAHGLRDFVKRGPDGRFAPIPFGAEFGLGAPPVWKLLSANGIRCGLVNAPLAYPADVPGGFVNQHLLESFAFHLFPDASWRRKMSAPAEVYDRIVAEFGPYGTSPVEVSEVVMPSILLDRIRRQTRALGRLLAEQEWEFCLTRLTQVADAQHYLWARHTGSDGSMPCAVRDTYTAVDAALSVLLEDVGPATTVFVVSDSGAAPLRSGIHLTRWLAREGFLGWRTPPARAPETRTRPAVLRRAVNAVARAVLPSRLRGSTSPPPAPPAGAFPGDEAIDWPSTRVYALGGEGALYVNLRGREPFGIVAPGRDCDALTEDLVARLGRLADPETGEPVVGRIHRGHELYRGSMVHDAPDLVVEWRDHAYLPTEFDTEPDRIFTDLRQRGKHLPVRAGHHPEGIVFARGPGVTPGRKLAPVSVFDLLPTWLRFFDVAPPSELEGRALAL